MDADRAMAVAGRGLDADRHDAAGQDSGCRHDGELTCQELDAVVDHATLLEERTVLCCHSGRLPLQDLNIHPMAFESSVNGHRRHTISRLEVY